MALKEIHHGIVILVDAEFTCWKGSLASMWSDPERPAEMIEIGMIAYDAVTRTELASYTSAVKPLINPVLSDYCLDILPITQPEVDAAPAFEQVMPKIAEWLNQHVEPNSPTAAWGTIDRSHISSQSGRCGISDPFGSRKTIRVDELVKSALGIDPGIGQIQREDVRKALNIKTISGRHRALADSADLIAFDIALADRSN